MAIKLPGIADKGVFKDVEDYLLDVNSWTDARNVRFRDKKVVRSLGESLFTAPPIVPYWGLHCFDGSRASHWLEAGLTKVYDFAGGVHTDITRVSGDYNASIDNFWNGGVLGGLPVINNAVDVPQVWNPVSVSQKLIDLPNWPSGHTCSVLRVFKNFLFALAPVESSVPFPSRVRISHPADPGSVPASWDETDVTKDVYVQDLSDTEAGALVDAAPLGNIMVLYKQRAAHLAQFIGGQQKWSILPKYDFGLMADHCVTAFTHNEQTKHFVMTGEDIVTLDGQSFDSILDERMRRWLLRNMDPITFTRSFTIAHSQEKECWFCFPLLGATWPNVALVWNWVKDTITFRDLNAASFIAVGNTLLNQSDQWDADGDSWDSDTTSWNAFSEKPFAKGLVQICPTTTQLRKLEDTQQFMGQNYRAYVERTGIDLFGVDRYGNLQKDPDIHKLLKGVWISATGAPFYVQIAGQDFPSGPITWSMPQLFVPGVDKKVDVTVEMQLWGIRFYSDDPASWEIDAFRPDVVPLGGF